MHERGTRFPANAPDLTYSRTCVYYTITVIAEDFAELCLYAPRFPPEYLDYIHEM